MSSELLGFNPDARVLILNCDALGMHDLAPAVIDHPLSTLTEAEIEARAEQAAGQCVNLWLGRFGR